MCPPITLLAPFEGLFVGLPELDGLPELEGLPELDGLPLVDVLAEAVTNWGGNEKGSRPEKIGLGLGPPPEGVARVPDGPVVGTAVGPPEVVGPIDTRGGSAAGDPPPSFPMPSSATTRTAAMMPPILRARRSRSLSGMRQAPDVSAAGDTLGGVVVVVPPVVVPVAPDVGPGDEPGPALESLV